MKRFEKISSAVNGIIDRPSSILYMTGLSTASVTFCEALAGIAEADNTIYAGVGAFIGSVTVAAMQGIKDQEATDRNELNDQLDAAFRERQYEIMRKEGYE